MQHKFLFNNNNKKNYTRREKIKHFKHNKTINIKYVCRSVATFSRRKKKKTENFNLYAPMINTARTQSKGISSTKKKTKQKKIHFDMKFKFYFIRKVSCLRRRT